MKQLTCEMCGSTDLMKQDGVFVCQVCGTKYTLEEAKRAMAILRSKGLDAYYTKGKKPSRAFWNAYNKVKPKIAKYLKEKFDIMLR